MSDTSPLHSKEIKPEGAGNSRYGESPDESMDAVRERERLLRLITDRSPLLIASVGIDGTYKFVNKPYAERFGMRQQDVVGMKIRDVIGEEAYARIEPHV